MFGRNGPNLRESVSDQLNSVKKNLRECNPSGEISVLEIKRQPPRGVWLSLGFSYLPEEQKRNLTYTDGRLYFASNYGHSVESLYWEIERLLKNRGLS
jgi:hypothetical protein